MNSAIRTLKKVFMFGQVSPSSPSTQGGSEKASQDSSVVSPQPFMKCKNRKEVSIQEQIKMTKAQNTMYMKTPY